MEKFGLVRFVHILMFGKRVLSWCHFWYMLAGLHVLYAYLQAGIQSRKYLQPLLYKRFLKSKNHSEDKFHVSLFFIDKEQTFSSESAKSTKSSFRTMLQNTKTQTDYIKRISEKTKEKLYGYFPASV